MKEKLQAHRHLDQSLHLPRSLKKFFIVNRSPTPNPKFGSSVSVDSGITKSTVSLKVDMKHKDQTILEKIRHAQNNKSTKALYSSTGAVIEDPDIIAKMTQFRGKNPIQGETIDIYWLYDDGGLTLLLPFILKMRSKFNKCNLRVFCLVDNIENMEEEAKSMTILLKKFRIAFQDVILLSDAKTVPNKTTTRQFETMVNLTLIQTTITDRFSTLRRWINLKIGFKPVLF